MPKCCSGHGITVTNIKRYQKMDDLSPTIFLNAYVGFCTGGWERSNDYVWPCPGCLRLNLIDKIWQNKNGMTNREKS